MATFVILICNDDQYAYVDEGRESLSPGETWSFSGEGGQIICGTVIETSTVTPNYSAVSNYDGCGECLSATTTYITANTVEDICIVLCDPTDVIEASAPHPIWTGIYGEQITQGNAITLGGPNGLNA